MKLASTPANPINIRILKTLPLIVLLCLSLLIPMSNLVAQEILTPMREMYCKPGVDGKSPSKGILVEYGLFPSYKINAESEKNSHLHANEHLLIKLKAPIINRKRIKFLIGVRHFREAYDFGSIDVDDQWLFKNLENKTLKNTRFSAYLSGSISSKHYFGFKGEAAYTGDYKGLVNLDKRYRHLYLVSIFGMKPHAKKEWGLGVVSRFGFRGNMVLPFLIYNQTFNEHWGLEFTAPVKMMLRYNLNKKSLFLFGPEFGSRFYSVDFMETPTNGPVGQYNIRRSETQLNMAYHQQVSSWFWCEIKMGYVHYNAAEFQGVNSAEAIDFEINPSDGLFLKLGVFLSPPKSYFDK